MGNYFINPVFVGDLVTNQEDLVTITIPLTNSEVKIGSNKFVELIKLFNGKEHVTESELLKILDDKQIAYLTHNDLLSESPFEAENIEGVKQWIDYGWHEALVFHLLSEKIQYEDDNWNVDETVKMRNELVDRYSDFLSTYIPSDYIKEIRLLSKINKLSKVTFEEALLNRRSNQPWKKEKMEFEELSEILFVACYKMREKRKENKEILNQKDIENYYKLYKNSYVDAFYFYIVIYDVEGLESGIYFYDITNHNLHLIKKGLFRNEISEICIGQRTAGSGKVSIVLTIDWLPYMIRYQHERAYRNLFIAAGQIMQNLLITFSGMNRSMFITPAIREEKADALFGLNNFEQSIVYFTTVG